ncbi:MAG: hypothetical protein ACI93T_001092, partial [Porticoccaceae bacterium]
MSHVESNACTISGSKLVRVRDSASSLKLATL